MTAQERLGSGCKTVSLRREILSGLGLAAFGLASLCLGLRLASAQPASPPELRNPNILFDYYEPRSAELVPLYQKLKQRQMLERLGEFLAPVRWPKTLRLILKQCPAAGKPPPLRAVVFYSQLEYSLTICYEWLKFLGQFHPPDSYATRQEVIVGGLVGIVLHEAGRAVFDIFGVPRLGSEEDAADQLASFVGLQFGKDVSRILVKGTYYVWDTYDYDIRVQNNQQFNFADRASVAPQRAYNLLCIAYGGDPATFQELVDKGLLDRVMPAGRASDCPDEYQQVAQAFDSTIKPHVDAALMSKVLTMTWLLPDDLQ